jgi:Uma2 family endonuclease
MPVLPEPPLLSEQAQSANEQRLVLYNVPWDHYEQLCELLEEHNVRLTYQQGTLEIMAPSSDHGFYGFSSGHAVVILAEELSIPILPGGIVTLKSQAVERGIEPDNCFWVASEESVRGKETIDLDVDPPPDLFVEIEITHSFLDRLEIAAKLEIPEVWRIDGDELKVLLLQPDGTYSESEWSRSFADFPVKEIVPFLKRSTEVDYLTQMRGFREWVRKQLDDRQPGTA